jgi:putative acyl-CoA dehydrogenase
MAAAAKSALGKLGPTVTHNVLNQGQLFRGNIFAADSALQAALQTHGADAALGATARLQQFGAWAGSDSTAEHARAAHTYGPVLRQFDRNGRRIDVVDYHPSYHNIYRTATELGVSSLAWRPADEGAGAGSHLVRGALAMLSYQAEPGTSCPLTMTYAAVPALREGKGFADYVAKALTPAYDPRDAPIDDKRGIVFGACECSNPYGVRRGGPL